MINIIAGFAAAAAVMLASSKVHACTGTYAGRKVTENGSVLIARTEDLDSRHPKSMEVYPAMEHEEGSMYRSGVTGFEYPNPRRTYKYFAVPDSDGDSDDGTYDEVGFNEKGVAVTATVSADVNDEINAVDPLNEDGLREADIATLVLSQAETARKGVELIAEIVDKKGSAEGNIVMIADKKEAWYMEILSGHQYIAVKMPEDAVAVIPNCFMIGYQDLDDRDVIYSEDLVDLPERHGLLKKEKGRFSLRKTYGPPLERYNRDRLWGGRRFLAPSLDIPYDWEYELFFKPDRKISVRDIMELQKYRYEDTELNANLPENCTEENKVRPIGTPNQHECHIIEIKDEFPKEAPGILWLCLGNAEHNVYLPYFPVIDEVLEEYSQRSHFFSEKQAFWAFRAQAALSELNREKYGANVRKYWDIYQDEIIENQKEKNREFLNIIKYEGFDEAVKYANRHTADLQRESYTRALRIYRELFSYVAGEAGHIAEEPFMPSSMINEE